MGILKHLDHFEEDVLKLVLLGCHPDSNGNFGNLVTREDAVERILRSVEIPGYDIKDILLACAVWSGGDALEAYPIPQLRFEIKKGCDTKFGKNFGDQEFNYALMVKLAKLGGAPFREAVHRAFPEGEPSLLKLFFSPFRVIFGASLKTPFLFTLMGNENSREILKRFPYQVARMSWSIWVEESQEESERLEKLARRTGKRVA